MHRDPKCGRRALYISGKKKPISLEIPVGAYPRSHIWFVNRPNSVNDPSLQLRLVRAQGNILGCSKRGHEGGVFCNILFQVFFSQFYSSPSEFKKIHSPDSVAGDQTKGCLHSLKMTVTRRYQSIGVG